MKDPPQASPRIHYIDNIRSVIVLLVVLFHGILPYSGICPWWYVSDPPPISWSMHFITFLDVIMMPILFLISGLLAWPSWERKGTRRFMAGKLKRLLFPYLLLTIFFSPAMPFIRQYLRALGDGVAAPGFWHYWLDYISSVTKVHRGAAGVSTDLVVNQYWFLILLFVFFSGFSLYASMRAGGRQENPENPSRKPVSRAALLGTITLFFCMLAAIYVLLIPRYPNTLWVTLGSVWQMQPVKLHIYLGFFIAGVYIERRGLLPGIISLTRPLVWFAAAVLITAAYLTAVIKTAGVPGASRALIIASQILRFFVLASVTMWLFALFHKRLDSDAIVWNELSANSYNIYLIHMTVLVFFQMLMIPLRLPSTLKFLICSLLTVLVCWLAGKYIVNRSRIAAIAVIMLIFVLLSTFIR